MPPKTQSVPIAEATKAVKDMTRRVGLLHLCYARTLVEELGQERGRELIRQAIWDYGTEIGHRTRQRVEEMGLEPTLENLSQGSDLSPLGFESTEAAVDGEPRSAITKCPLAEVWHEYGEDELGGLYCLVDPAKMQAYDPSWTMVHTRRMPNGDEWCEIAVRRVEDAPEV